MDLNIAAEDQTEINKQDLFHSLVKLCNDNRILFGFLTILYIPGVTDMNIEFAAGLFLSHETRATEIKENMPTQAWLVFAVLMPNILTFVPFSLRSMLNLIQQLKENPYAIIPLAICSWYFGPIISVLNFICAKKFFIIMIDQKYHTESRILEEIFPSLISLMISVRTLYYTSTEMTGIIKKCYKEPSLHLPPLLISLLSSYICWQATEVWDTILRPDKNIFTCKNLIFSLNTTYPQPDCQPISATSQWLWSSQRPLMTTAANILVARIINSAALLFLVHNGVEELYSWWKKNKKITNTLSKSCFCSSLILLLLGIYQNISYVSQFSNIIDAIFFIVISVGGFIYAAHTKQPSTPSTYTRLPSIHDDSDGTTNDSSHHNTNPLPGTS